MQLTAYNVNSIRTSEHQHENSKWLEIEITTDYGEKEQIVLFLSPNGVSVHSPSLEPQPQLEPTPPDA